MPRIKPDRMPMPNYWRWKCRQDAYAREQQRELAPQIPAPWGIHAAARPGDPDNPNRPRPGPYPLLSTADFDTVLSPDGSTYIPLRPITVPAMSATIYYASTPGPRYTPPPPGPGRPDDPDRLLARPGLRYSQ